jgi:hypothetical protein
VFTFKNAKEKVVKGIIINIFLFTSPLVFGQHEIVVDTLEVMQITNSNSNTTKEVVGTIKKNSLLGSGNKLIQNKDSLNRVEKIKSSGSLFLKKQIQVIKPTGNISVGYEYGVLPFVSGDNYPAGGISSNGNISFLLLNIPLELTYHYTSIKNVIGLNNYFRISYDTDRYKEQLNQQMNIKNQLGKADLSKLQLQQQKSLQKIEYLNYLQKHPNYKTLADTTKANLNYNIPDSSGIPSYSNPLDTLGLNYDSSIPYNTTINRNDSISNELLKSRAQYDSISNLIVKTKQQIEQIKNIQNNSEQLQNPYLSGVQNFLSGIKKFEIGLCHPSYSMFLVNNVPLQGINIEYSRNNNFIGFTYGTTINNLMFNTNTVQGAMETARNLYNYFDFGNLSAGRKIVCLKGGVGTKEGSHMYIGFLAGKGRTDYLHPLPDGGTSTVFSKESNFVMELDAKYKVSEKMSVDFLVGKSSVQTGDLNSEGVSKAVSEIFSDYRSNAFMVRLNAAIKKTSTKVTISTRWIDPYFRSFGIGFLRSDNLRYEIKAEQPITKRIKYSIAYRREEDNLLNLYNYKNTLQSINNSLNIKLSRQVNIRLVYVPLFRELRSENITIKDRNAISTVILSYTPKAKKVNSQFNALYSRYIITGDSVNINFENFTYTHNFLMKSGFKTGLNISWFKNNLSDTLGNDTYLSVLDVGYSSKKGNSITIGGKMAYKQKTELQYGFLLRGKVKIYKGLFGEIEAEKILIGDYYNSFVLWKIQSFPYYCSARLIFNF